MGYVFIKFEGLVDGSASGGDAADDAFVYHVGTLNMLRSVEIPYNITLAEGGSGTLHLDVDLGQFLTGIDWTTDFDTHTGNNMPLATLIADNGTTAITAE